MKLRTQMMSGYLLVFLVVVFVAGVSYWSRTNFFRLNEEAERIHEVLTKARLIEKLVVDMQTAKRGFLLTGEEEYLDPYKEAQDTYERELSRIADLVSGDPRQLTRIEEIDVIVKQYRDTVLLPQIEDKRRGTAATSPAEGALDKATDRRGREFMVRIRDSLGIFISAEQDHLIEGQKAEHRSAFVSLCVVWGGAAAAVALGLAAMFITTRSILRAVGGEPAAIAGVAEEIAKGNLDIGLAEVPGAGTGIGASIGAMLLALRQNREQVEQQDWLKTGLARLNEVMSGDPALSTLASGVISEMATYVGAQVGAFYVARNGNGQILTLLGSYAYTKRKNLSNEFKPGEGLVGQAAIERNQILVANVPEDYVKVTSGLGERTPRFICVTPFLHEDRLKGVVELGTLNELSDQQLEYVAQAMPALAIAVESAESRASLAESLEESRQLAEELQSQQEELQVTNEQLEEQTQRLKESEERLRAQQEELEVSNEELEEKNNLLERQKKEVERARKEIEDKAAEVTLASKYKSEFLANMSHELRTPLNSLLLLAQSLAENKEGNLSVDQVESARVIHGSGSDLLNLINEILDLSKIEAGRMDVHEGIVAVGELADAVRTTFQHMAAEKGLKLEVRTEEDAPEKIQTDRKRLEQILKNLVSNAIKFTDTGSVDVVFSRPRPGVSLSRSGLAAGNALAISVVDTGIGITPEQQKVIFEAFQQGDGSTSRQYGGTGLGLTISRELAGLLGGEIQVESEPGKGSTFTFYLPVTYTAHEPKGRVEPQPRPSDDATPGSFQELAALSIPDDRDTLAQGDRIMLVIEDDPRFAKVLYGKCHDRGLKCLAAPTGEAGLALADQYQPAGILLDLRLPRMDGWGVLDALKENTRTRHIPVHILSVEDASTESLRRGAVGHFSKPVDRGQLDAAFERLEEASAQSVRHVLVVEDDEVVRASVVSLIQDSDVKVDEVSDGAQALAAIRSTRYDCVILDLGLPDMDGRQMLQELSKEDVPLPPVIIHTANDLTHEEEMTLREYADSIVLKDVRSQERLLDEVSLFLHRVVSEMPEKKRQMIVDLHETDAVFRGKKVLVVDDDMRTAFAMSKFLGDRGLNVLKAENGQKALRLLEREPDADLVLMDIMMPVLDGYETMKKIRSQERFRSLPIIALTAKAMKEDREKCIAAGANDYISKPVDQARLISMMRVWLYR